MIKPCGKALYSFQNLTFVNLNQSSFHLGLLTMDRASFSLFLLHCLQLCLLTPPYSITLKLQSAPWSPMATKIINGPNIFFFRQKKKKSSLLYLNTWSLCPLYAFLYWKNTLELHYKVPIWSINLCGAHFV